MKETDRVKVAIGQAQLGSHPLAALMEEDCDPLSPSFDTKQFHDFQNLQIEIIKCLTRKIVRVKC